jgi:predicted nucleic acid-binding protein
LAISSIVAHELFYGAFKSRRAAQNVALIDALQFSVVEFDKEDARPVHSVHRWPPKERQSVPMTFSLLGKLWRKLWRET